MGYDNQRTFQTSLLAILAAVFWLALWTWAWTYDLDFFDRKVHSNLVDFVVMGLRTTALFIAIGALYSRARIVAALALGTYTMFVFVIVVFIEIVKPF